jgi:DNA-binding NarL/FixJ family response regulator
MKHLNRFSNNQQLYMNNFPQQDLIIADTQALTIEGLKVFLHESFQKILVVKSRYDLIKSLQVKVPSLLILDYCLLDFENYNDLREFTLTFPELVIVIVTNNLTRTEIIELNQCGIKNILHKSTEKEELFECIQAALKGKKYYSGLVLDLLLEPGEKKVQVNGQVQLTPSEIDIIRLIAEGLTNKEIARRKILSIHTIMTHRKNILRKSGASNASEMIMFAIKAGIIDNIEYHICNTYP